MVSAHTVRQAEQPIAHNHQHVFNTALLDLGEDLKPVLRTLTTTFGVNNMPARSRSKATVTGTALVSTIFEHVPLRTFPSAKTPRCACRSRGDR